ncbi:hypothetical protein AGMMS49940_14260 [Spirochaetia bacterium]|nr:hypothetical protein AGMMS49940_14260 [Spirochaetia bacterium]
MAASEAKSAIKNTIVISDLSTIVKMVQEIENDIRNEKYDVSYLRINDLIHSLIQIKQLIISMGYEEHELIKKMIVQLSILRRQLETVMYKNDDLDVLKVNQKLSEFEIELSELAAKIKFPLSGGKK